MFFFVFVFLNLLVLPVLSCSFLFFLVLSCSFLFFLVFSCFFLFFLVFSCFLFFFVLFSSFLLLRTKTHTRWMKDLPFTPSSIRGLRRVPRAKKNNLNPLSAILFLL